MQSLSITYSLFLTALAVIVCAAPPVWSAAADQEDAILVLDASGSMWGQIDGVNKIVIAKDVVEELTYKIPAQRRLGLVAYGHRKQSDCSDIETLANVGADREQLRQKIRELTPRGKTPLSASVKHAAENLNYTKNKSTVILVSDGKETCDFDPCELGRILEKNGLDFTVHVIGFDVTAEERQGLQCLAKETGGKFLAADDAGQLADALAEVAVGDPVKPAKASGEAVPGKVVLKATILEGGPQINSKLDWSIIPESGGEPVFTASNTGVAEAQIPPGKYRISARWSGWKHGGEKTGGKTLTVRPSYTHVVSVPIDLALPVSLDAPARAGEGEVIEVTWSGPDNLDTHVNISETDSAPLDEIYFFNAGKARTKAKVGADGPATWKLQTPPLPGEYEIRYLLRDPAIVLARRRITLDELQYTISAAPSAPISSVVTVNWQGPRHPGDFIALMAAGAEPTHSHKHTGKLKDDGTANITMPAEAGDYELRYVTSAAYNSNAAWQYQVQASTPIQVTAVQASLRAPATAEGGSTINIEWSGPEGAENDWISVVEAGANKANRDSTLSRLADREGVLISPAPIRVPAISGDYEVVYIVQPGAKIVARAPISIAASQASVKAPRTVKAGEPFEVQFSGSAFHGDRVVMVKADTPDHKMWGVTPRYGYIAKPDQTTGTVTGWVTKDKPGDYEIRYVTGLQHQVLARQKITVTE